MREPSLNPPEQVLLVIANYGPEGGGWGPAAIATPLGPGPFVYTGTNMERMTEVAEEVAKMLSNSGLEARVVRFSGRVDLKVFEP